MAVFTTGGFMKKAKFTESQIVPILREVEYGIAITEVLRSHGISAASFYSSVLNMGVLKHLGSNRLKDLSSSSLTTKPWWLSSLMSVS
jgi:putative transposase